MNDTLILVSLLGLVGLFLGAWLQRQGPARRRQAALLGLTLVLLPVGALDAAQAPPSAPEDSANCER